MNGIGGRTIAEAQEKLSIREYQLWIKYRQRVGSLNSAMRTEWGAALIASVLANVNRGKDTPPFKLTDFAPHINSQTVQQQGISLEQAINEWE